MFLKSFLTQKSFLEIELIEQMQSNDRKELVNVFTGVCFEDLKEEFNKWINHSYETSELVSKALEIIKNQYIQNVYAGPTPQNRLIGTIDRAIASPNILNKISSILEQVRIFLRNQKVKCLYTILLKTC